MSNQLEFVKQINKLIDDIISKIKVLDTEIIDLSKSARKTSDSFQEIKTSKDVEDKIKKLSDSTELLNEKVKERDRQEKALNKTLARKELAEEATNKALIKTRFEQQQQNKLIKEATVISSRYATQLQKTSALRNKAARTIQDLNLKKQLGIKLSNEEQKELKESVKEFNRYDKAIKKAKTSVNRFQEDVGKYPSVLGSSVSAIKGLVGAFGLLEGLRIGFDFTKEALALAREAKGVEFAFKRLGAEGLEAFENIKRSTRGLLSDLDIKRSLNEFKNFNISLEETDTLFEFLVVRAAQTGRSVDKLRDSLVEGLSKESKLRIDNLGISFAELNEELGRTPNFVQAVANIAKTEIAEAGNILDETANSQEKFNAAFENFKVSAGSGFIGRLTNDIYDLGTSFVSVLSDINTASDGFTDLIKNLSLYATGQGVLVSGEAILKRELEKRKPIVEEIIAIQKEQGTIELQLNLNREKYLKTNSEELTLLLKSLQKKEEEKEVVKNSVKVLREKISVLKKEQETLTINDLSRSKAINNEIRRTEDLIKTILLLNDARKKSEPITDAFVEAFERAEKAVKAYKEVFKDDLSKIEAPEIDTASIDKALEEINATIRQEVRDAFDADLLNESFDELSETIQFFTGVNGQVFSDFFRKITNEGIKSFEDIADVAEASFEVIGELGNAFYNSRIEQYEADIEANNLYYENLLNNATLTEEEQTRLELDRQAKEKEIREKQRKEKIKQAQFERAIQIANIIVNTSSAVVEALPNIPLSIAVGALGLAQLGVALATPIPQFAEGGVMEKDGLMMINDHKSGRLEVVERDGKFLMTDKKNAIVEGKRGDIIHKDAGLHFSNLSDSEIIKDVNYHSMMATLQNQNFLISRLENKKVIDNDKKNTEKLIKAIKSQKTKFNLNQNINLAEDLNFLNRLNNAL